MRINETVINLPYHELHRTFNSLSSSLISLLLKIAVIWLVSQFSFSQWLDRTSTHWRREFFSRQTLFVFTTHAYNYFAPKFLHFAKKYRPWNQALTWNMTMFFFVWGILGGISFEVTTQGGHALVSQRRKIALCVLKIKNGIADSKTKKFANTRK